MTEWRTGRAADVELKRGVLERLRKARSEGLSTGKLANSCDGEISIHTIYDMLEAKSFPENVWRCVDEGLKKFGY
jgi:hypothetical protein